MLTKNSLSSEEEGIPRELIEIGSLNGIYTTLECRTIRIGSFKYSPVERVLFTNKGLKIVSPTIDDSTNKQILHIQFREVVKILVHFGKMLPVIFIYTLPSCSRYVREQLHMTDNSNYYFDSVSKDESFKRITLLPEIITDEVRDVIKKLYGKPQNIIDELTGREANDILMKTCPRDRSGLNASKIISNTSLNNSLIRQILIYPPGKGGISINTEDFMCLAQDQFLNDVIIDFFLKYLCKDMLTPEQRNKTHVLSSFFYKRLTTKPTKNNRSNPADSDPKLSAAQKRHSRVKSWTKNVNIFEKDFIVIPINENSHWFLAIICFPGMKSPRTMLTNKPIDFKDLKNYTKKKLAVTVPEKKLEITIGATTITPVKQAEPIQIPVKPEIDPDLERDEAEGSDSELEMSDTGSEADEEASNVREGIKQPCILIFDSLAGGVSRSRVVATLRDYLTCELQSKTGTNESFNKENMKGSCPKIPQQNNFTDCGLYLLQYVEQFFKEPINDYRIPIKQLVNWFEEIVVTRKREEISNLLKKLVEEYNPDSLPLPDIVFPTLNGKLLEQEEMGHPAFYDSEENEIEEEFDDEECEEEETEEDLSHDMESECDFPDNLTEQSEKEILKTVNKRRLIISNDESVVPTKQLKLSDSIEHPNGIPKLNKKNLAKDNEKTFL